MAWHIDRQQDCLPDVQWRRGRLVSWPQHGRHCMATVCACGGTRWMECRCEVWESATSYGDEQQCVSSYYQYACVQSAGAAAEHLQGRAWPVFLILLDGGSRRGPEKVGFQGLQVSCTRPGTAWCRGCRGTSGVPGCQVQLESSFNTELSQASNHYA